MDVSNFLCNDALLVNLGLVQLQECHEGFYELAGLVSDVEILEQGEC